MALRRNKEYAKHDFKNLRKGDTALYVKCKLKKADGTYGGNDYAFNCTIDAKVGDMVVVKTSKGFNKAIITKINVPESEIDPKWIHNLAPVTENLSEI